MDISYTKKEPPKAERVKSKRANAGAPNVEPGYGFVVLEAIPEPERKIIAIAQTAESEVDNSRWRIVARAEGGYPGPGYEIPFTFQVDDEVMLGSDRDLFFLDIPDSEPIRKLTKMQYCVAALSHGKK